MKDEGEMNHLTLTSDFSLLLSIYVVPESGLECHLAFQEKGWKFFKKWHLLDQTSYIISRAQYIMKYGASSSYIKNFKMTAVEHQVNAVPCASSWIAHPLSHSCIWLQPESHRKNPGLPTDCNFVLTCSHMHFVSILGTAWPSAHLHCQVRSLSSHIVVWNSASITFLPTFLTAASWGVGRTWGDTVLLESGMTSEL